MLPGEIIYSMVRKSGLDCRVMLANREYDITSLATPKRPRGLVVTPGGVKHINMSYMEERCGRRRSLGEALRKAEAASMGDLATALRDRLSLLESEAQAAGIQNAI